MKPFASAMLVAKHIADRMRMGVPRIGSPTTITTDYLAGGESAESVKNQVSASSRSGDCLVPFRLIANATTMDSKMDLVIRSWIHVTKSTISCGPISPMEVI